MFVACSESVASAELLEAFPAAYVLQTLARPQEELDAASRATLEFGLVASGVRHVDENRSKVVAAIRKHGQLIESLREKVACT